MTKLSRLARLAQKYIPALILLIKLIDALVELLSKAVNYASRFSQFLIFIQEQTR